MITYCPKNITFFTIWYQRAFSLCFIDTVTILILTTLMLTFGTAELLMYHRYGSRLDNAGLKLYTVQLCCNIILICCPFVWFGLRYWVDEEIYSYMIVYNVLAFYIWSMSVRLLDLERNYDLPTSPGARHSVLLNSFWGLALTFDSLSFVNFNGDRWYFIFHSSKYQILLAIFVVRWICTFFMFVLGMYAPGIVSIERRRQYTCRELTDQSKEHHNKMLRSGFQTKHQNVKWLNSIQNQIVSNNIVPNDYIYCSLNAVHPLSQIETFDEYTRQNVHYEIKPSDVSIVDEIGDGNYGIVAKGILHNHRGLSRNIVVALKTLKYGNRLEETCLSNELNTLLHIGQHCNIISMIGAITKPCHLGRFILVNEFCQLGDLENYIKQRKSLYEIGREYLAPIDELDSILNGSYLCFSALLMYALQIANGAYYYTEIKTVIHRDLALRNILLTSDHVVRIADFGLVVKAARYDVKHPKPSPIPWYAPECLHGTSAVFTAESDVWSYGVILWELFNLAGNVWHVQAPKREKELLEWISLGKRYEIPKYASKEIAQLMEKCWQFLPENRPNFLQCRTEIQNILLHYSEVFNYISQKIGL